MESDSNVFQWKFFLRQAIVCSIAWTCYFTYGMVLGTPTVTIPQLRAAGNSTEYVSDEMASWISSVVGYIGMVWVFILATVVHQYGVKIAAYIQIINSFAAYTVLYFSQNPVHVLISQIMHGSSAATQNTTALLIMTEYTTPSYRGLLLPLKSASFFWGIWIANALGLYFPYKYIGLFGIICTIYIFTVTLLVPESPYWLAKNERYDECAKAHRWLKGVNSAAEKELEAIITTQKTYKSFIKPKKTLMQRAKSYASLITEPEMYQPIVLCFLLYSMYHLSGKLVFTVYSIDIIKKITNSQSTAHIGMLILDGITILGMYVGCGLSKKLKRRTLILGGSSMATVFLVIMAAYLYLVRLDVIKENGYASVGLLLAFSLTVACGPLIMVSTIGGELIPIRSRTFCLCATALFAKLILGVVLKIAPYVMKNLGTDGSFLFFAIISTILVIVAYKYLPETKDKTLIEIAEYFRKDKALKAELISLKQRSGD